VFLSFFRVQPPFTGRSVSESSDPCCEHKDAVCWSLRAGGWECK
jgi:hypothetical protein